MKKIALLLFSLAITMALPCANVMAEILFMRDVNTACNTGMDPTVITVECSSCHNLYDFDEKTPGQDRYENDGACAFCDNTTTNPNPSCAVIRPTTEELLAEAQGTTNDYFETLFALFMKAMAEAAATLPGGMTDPNIFAAVFPDCPDIAPAIASEFSRNTGSLIRRVSKRTRNHRNTPDTWEAKQLERFESMAKGGKPRTTFIINKPDNTPENPSTLTTREFESYAIVDGYFRYMRSITMPPLLKPDGTPNLPCLKCHGTFEELAPGVREAIGVEYAYDVALGYKKGDIRGAWTIKIPMIEREGKGKNDD